MDDKKVPKKTPAPPPEADHVLERIGEILRSERERRGISIFVIAKDLRLNPRFIEALEANDYDQLPGDTYIRVYLRSLCKYFSLNADELLERFFKERGLSGVDTLRKDSSTKINLVALREKEKPNKTAILAASIFIFIALLSYMAARQGWFSTEPASSISSVTDSAGLKNGPGDSVSANFTEAADTLQPGSLGYDSSDFENTALLNKAKSEKDTLAEVQAKKMSTRDSTRSAKAKARFIKDSILKAGASNRIIKDSILKADAKSAIVKDSIQKAEAKNGIIKDSILKADAKSKSIKDSVLKTEAKDKITRDSILKAEEKNRIALEEISKAQAKAKVIRDSILKAEAINKAARDSILKADAKNKAAKDSLKSKNHSSIEKTAPNNGREIALKLEVTGKSAWARVLYDGVPWRNILKKGATQIFTVKDSLNLRTGQLEDIVLSLNGKKLDVPSSGIVALKIDHSGVTVWTDEQWFKLTKGRF